MYRARSWFIRARPKEMSAGAPEGGIQSAYRSYDLRAFQVSEEGGAFAGLAMGLNGLATSVLFPLLVWLVGWH